MNLPPQPPSSEEPEQQPTLHPSESEEKAPTQPEHAADSPSSEEPERQTTPTVEEPEEPQPEHAADSSSEETEPVAASEEDMSTQPVSSFEADEAEDSSPDEDNEEAFAPTQAASPVQSSPAGVFIRKSALIAAACAVVVVALLVVLLVVVTRPKDPPTDWIASYTPPAGASSTGKVLYYLHWTNQNGALNGQMQFAAKANGAPQSLTAPATGLYNKDNHIIYVVITINGQPATLTGKINDNNDTLTLNEAGATSQSSQFVFHTGNANDYKQATQKLAAGTSN
jgi:hypothetical protein